MFCVVPKPRTAFSTAATSPGSELPPHPPSPSVTASAKGATVDRIRLRVVRTTGRFAFAAAFAWLIGAIMPVTGAASGPAASEGLPDVWSGSWPAQLMPGAVQLGTLTWREIRYEDGLGMVGKNFGGRLFEGCPADGVTRFFRGKYVKGGNLVGCTVGADASTLVGRFDGNEQLRSGSFTIKIVIPGPKPLFFGQYFEDNGITTDWCGTLEQPLGTSAPRTPAPSATALATARKGGAAPLRFSVFGGDGKVQVTLTVSRNGRTVHRMTLPGVRTDGSIVNLRWRPPVSLHGRHTVCVVARDAAGRASKRSCAPLRL
jgi:hypothetical protein